METLETFRTETRDWLEANYPDALKTPFKLEELVGGGSHQVFFHPDAKLWLDRMAEKGWTAPTWPKEYGGGGLNKDEAKILGQEMARLKCRPPLGSMGLAMLGPTLLTHGSEEQKKEHLPKIADGSVSWCQGYSEPNAGSDLASLQMRAEDKGDHYLVNGAKIWTSNADTADWMFSLVRTDPNAKKHSGISLILYDRTAPGVTINPIELINGYSSFYETVIEDLKVPKGNLVGEENMGWGIAKFLLTHERTMISGMGARRSEMRTVAEIAKEYIGEEDGRVADPIVRDQIVMQDMDDAAFALCGKRYAEQAKKGEGPGHASSMFKHLGTKYAKSKFELLVSIGGTQSLGWEGEGFSEAELLQARGWLRSKGNSIEGGTSEVMLNIIATRVLGLPK